MGDRPHPPYLRVCLTSPPSPGPLSQGSSSVPRTLFSFLIERVDYLKLPLIIPGLIHFSLIISERTYNRNRKRTSKQAIAMLNVIHLQCEIRLRAVSYFSLQSYYTQNLSTRAAKPLAARNEGISSRSLYNNIVVCNRAG